VPQDVVRLLEDADDFAESPFEVGVFDAAGVEFSCELEHDGRVQLVENDATQSAAARLEDIDDFQQIAAVGLLSLQLLVAQLVDQKSVHLPVQLAQRVLCREKNVVISVQRLRVLLHERFNLMDVVAAERIQLVVHSRYEIHHKRGSEREAAFMTSAEQEK
jgi:hypothetical protein